MATDPMNAIGHPIPDEGREAGYQALRGMGLDSGESMEITAKVARALEDDQPFRAQEFALKQSRVDLTGYFRLVATMLATVEV